MPGLPPRRPGRRARGAGPRAAAHRAAPPSTGWRTGSALREGQRLVEALACRRCHTIGGKGNRLATSLDAVVWKREQAQLVSSIREPVENMPQFGLDEAPGGGDRRLPAAEREPRPAPGHLPRPLHPRREPELDRLREGVRRLPPLPRARRPRRHRERRPQPLRPLHAVLPEDGAGRPRVDREGARRLAAQPARAPAAHDDAAGRARRRRPAEGHGRAGRKLTCHPEGRRSGRVPRIR